MTDGTSPSAGAGEACSLYLYPGKIFAERTRHMVSTILGSCVAVCLYDRSLRIGGINHYLLPFGEENLPPDPRYGDAAIELLVQRLSGFGCTTSALAAKVFGGASMWESVGGLFDIGDQNVEIARKSLCRLGITVAAADTGGDAGRRIIFDSGTGEVLLRRIPRAIASACRQRG